MEQPWRLVAAIGVMAALVGGIAWFGLRTGNDAQAGSRLSVSTSTTESAPPTIDPGAPVSDDPVIVATKRALAAWGTVAVTGDLAMVDGWFVADGPQMSQLRTEATQLRADPAGLPPYEFELRDPTVARPASEEAVVTSLVVMTRPGEPAQEFDWRIHLRRVKGRWQLWTVEAVE